MKRIPKLILLIIMMTFGAKEAYPCEKLADETEKPAENLFLVIPKEIETRDFHNQNKPKLKRAIRFHNKKKKDTLRTPKKRKKLKKRKRSSRPGLNWKGGAEDGRYARRHRNSIQFQTIVTARIHRKSPKATSKPSQFAYGKLDLEKLEKLHPIIEAGYTWEELASAFHLDFPSLKKVALQGFEMGLFNRTGIGTKHAGPNPIVPMANQGLIDSPLFNNLSTELRSRYKYPEKWGKAHWHTRSLETLKGLAQLQQAGYSWEDIFFYFSLHSPNKITSLSDQNRILVVTSEKHVPSRPKVLLPSLNSTEFTQSKLFTELPEELKWRYYNPRLHILLWEMFQSNMPDYLRSDLRLITYDHFQDLPLETKVIYATFRVAIRRSSQDGRQVLYQICPIKFFYLKTYFRKFHPNLSIRFLNEVTP